MKTRSTLLHTSFKTSFTKVLFISFLLTGCAAGPNIVPQLPGTNPANTVASGQDIERANQLLAIGKRREAADAYFMAASNYPSPERERLILQAAELAAIFNDTRLTQLYLGPINYGLLGNEHKSRFRLIQAQLAFNDRNYRETLRILPQRVNDVPPELGKKVLDLRMLAAQSSGDKLALVQELVLQEPTLKEPYLVSLNQDRIWNHAQQIPAFQLDQAKNSIGHPILNSWLSLAQLSRVAKSGPSSKRQSLRGDLGRWIQNNPSHPGMPKALGLLNATPTTIVTPYSVAQKPVVARPPVKVVPKPVVVPRPVVKQPVRVVPRASVPAPVVRPQPVAKPAAPVLPKGPTAYDLIKKKLNLP